VAKRQDKRAQVIDQLAVHFLNTGLSDTGLRRLAEVAGTSDRMLLYYFANKDELVAAVLAHIADGQAAALTQLFGTARSAPDKLLETLCVAAKIQAFFAPLIATVATGTPGGICTIEYKLSKPLIVLVFTGTPITGKCVKLATIPGK
jgi:AcrR family transcriptional regulator